MLHMMWSYQLLIKPISQSSIVIANTISWKPPLFGVWKVKNVSGSDRVTWDSKCIPQIPQVGDGGCWYRLACILSFQYRILKNIAITTTWDNFPAYLGEQCINVYITPLTFILNQSINIDIRINGSELKRVKCFKYHGLIVDQKLKWIDHIAHVKHKIAQRLGIINKAKPFFNQKHVSRTYTTLLYTHISLIVWKFGVLLISYYKVYLKIKWLG